MIVGPTFFSSPTGDPYWDQVILLLHCDGVDGSTTFTDSSSYAQTMFLNAGSPRISTTQSKFGGASLTSIDIARAGRIGFVPGAEGVAEEYTIEFWIRPEAIDNLNFGFIFSNHNGLIRLSGPPEGAPYVGKISLINATVLQAASTTVLPLDTWTHVAVTREAPSPPANTCRLFIDGVKEAEGSSFLPPLNITGNPWEVGRTDLAGGSAIRGHIDDFRITTVCRYTADFDVPASAFPNGP